MAFAPPIKAKLSTNLAKSTWTPINNPDANNQVFEERRELINKWFQKWHESQKRVIVEDILKNLSNKHLISVSEKLKGKFPQEKHDFTKVFPRVLTLYVFSYLDPRTLCRCSQVSWYWNYLAEMDCLWRPKCLKFGWYPVYQPSPFEEKVWKRFYVTTVHELNYAKAKSRESRLKENIEETPRPDTARTAVSRMSTARSTSSHVTGLLKGPTTPSPNKPLSGPKWEPPPWKGSDKKPTDTMRYNYLDNKSKSPKKKASGLPSSRPSSQQSKRPQSAKGRRRQPESGAPFIDKHSPQKMDATMDQSRRLSADLSRSQTMGLSPRLDKNYQLPHHNGNSHSTVPLGTVQYGANETLKTKQLVNLSQRFASPPLNNPYETSNANSKTPYADPDITKLSIDAGVMPKPVHRMSMEKPKKSPRDEKRDTVPEKKEIVPAEASTLQKTNNTDDLKGQGWASPQNQNSDED